MGNQYHQRMNKIAYSFFRLSLAVLITSVAQGQPSTSAPSGKGPYHVSQTFHVGGEGGWDYLTADPEHKLLFVPRSTHTMVIDARTGRVAADIPGQKRNHVVALVASAGRGFITDGADGAVTVFDLNTYAVLGKVKAAEDAGVLIPISPDLDLATGKADAAVELGGKPEFLAADGQGKAYINLVDKDQVAVVDIKDDESRQSTAHDPWRLTRRHGDGCHEAPPVHRVPKAAEAGRHGSG